MIRQRPNLDRLLSVVVLRVLEDNALELVCAFNMIFSNFFRDEIIYLNKRHEKKILF